MSTKAFTIQDDFPGVSYAQWREMVEKELDGVPFDKKLVTRTYEGIALQPIYSAEQWNGEGDPTGFPGQAHFVRGAAAPAAAKGWDIRQQTMQPVPEKANAELLLDLQGGVTSVLVRFDRAARQGLDGDAEAAAELAGRRGVMIYALQDLTATLESIRADIAPVYLDPGASFMPAAAMLIAAWQKQGVELSQAQGSFGVDPLGEIAVHGLVPGSLETAYSRMTALASWTAEHLPKVTTIQVDTAAYHGAGASAVQDISYAVATGLEYARALVAGGMSLDDALGQITFSFSMGTNFFRAIAKLRAARRVWARVVEACGGSEQRQGMRIHARTSRRVMTQYDPWVNILRATTTTFAAALGGAEAITSAPFDQELGVSLDSSRRLARNTQIILQEESHLARVLDPAGGCWFIEKVTEEFAEAAWKNFQAIEAAGGMAMALTEGMIGKELAAAYEVRAKNLRRRKDAVTGVSEFPNLRENLPQSEQPDYVQLCNHIGEKLAVCRGTSSASEALNRVRRVLDKDELIQRLVEAAHAGATLGQLMEALDMGVQSINPPIPMRPLSEPFEKLRDRSDDYLRRYGKRPQAFMANLGPIAHHTVRSTWSRNLLEAGGIETLTNDGYKDAASAAEAFKASGAAIAVVCSSDKIYETQAEDTARALKAAGAKTVILAGKPADDERKAALEAAGIDLFIFMGCDVTSILETLMKQGGGIA